MLATIKPRDPAGKTRRRIAAEELAELVALDAKLKRATAGLKTTVTDRGSTLMDIHGIGPRVLHGSSPTSGTSQGSPTATGSRPGPAPHPSTPRRVSRSGTGSPGPGTGGSTTSSTSP